MGRPWMRVNGTARTASYDAVSAVLALEEGILLVSDGCFLCVFSYNFRVFTVYQCKTWIKGCNKLLLVLLSSWYIK